MTKFYECDPYPPHTCSEFKLEVGAVYLANFSSRTGQKQCYEFDCNGYLISEETFYNQKLTSKKIYTYNSSYRLLNILETNEDNRRVLDIIYNYNDSGFLASIIHRQANFTLHQQLINEYDEENKLIKKTLFHSESNIIRALLFYNKSELVERKEYFSIDGSQTQEVSVLHNSRKKIELYKINNIGADYSETYYQYDEKDRTIETVNYFYDTAGNLKKTCKTVTAFNNQSEDYSTSRYENGALISKVKYSIFSEQELIASGEHYDESGRVIQRSLQFDYPYDSYLKRDQLGRIIAELKIFTEYIAYNMDDYDSELNCFKPYRLDNAQTIEEEEEEILEHYLAIKNDFGSYKKYEECIQQDFPDSDCDEPEPEIIHTFMEIRYQP